MAWTEPTTSQATGKADYSGASTEVKRGHKIADLNTMYSEAEGADQAIFAEMRSNLLLVAGEHYQRKESNFFKRMRDTKELSNEQKLRLTKNHTRKICQIYSNNIMATTPDVGFTPKDEKSPHDQKVSEMHHSVWRDAYERYNIDDLMDDWCDNFVQIGEVSVKIFWDPAKGYIKGYRPKSDEQGQPIADPMGGMQPDLENPVFSGEFVFEEIYGFNLLRPADCKDLRKAEWIGLRKMVNKEELLLQFTEPEKQQFIQQSVDDTYPIFDAAFGGYHKAKNQVSVREYYFRPCAKYPKGWYYITTKEGILAEGELPGGIFPIVVQAFDRIQTTPRGRGPIKQMRPYQAEINRSASKIAEHQITLGDDKILTQNGTKISASNHLPGIRSYTYTGAQPTVFEGRSGAQYLDYMTSQITEMYQVMSVAEDSQESNIQLDPYVLLYRSARQKKKFQRYIKRFEKFLIQVVKTYLSLAKLHLADDALVYAIGSNEQINIPEFKKMPNLCYEVKIEAQSGDIETKLGKQIVLNHALQYVGSQLKPEDIGKIMRAMPLCDFDQSFDDFTMDYDNSVNEILSLDRGETPPIVESDTHPYIVKRLTNRMRKPDFQFLPPNVKANYAAKVQAHEKIIAFQAQQVQRAQQGFIPTGGGLVKCDVYVPDPKNPGNQRRMTIPEQALVWLQSQIDSQGGIQAALEGAPTSVQADISAQMQQLGGRLPTAPSPQAFGQPQSGPRPPMAQSPWGNLHPHPMMAGGNR